MIMLEHDITPICHNGNKWFNVISLLDIMITDTTFPINPARLLDISVEIFKIEEIRMIA